MKTLDDAGHGFGGGGVDPGDAALGGGAGHDVAVQQAGDVELGGILRGAGDLQAAVDAAARASDMGPAWVSSGMCVFLLDALVGLRLRRAGGGLLQGANDRADARVQS